MSNSRSVVDTISAPLEVHPETLPPEAIQLPADHWSLREVEPAPPGPPVQATPSGQALVSTEMLINVEDVIARLKIDFGAGIPGDVDFALMTSSWAMHLTIHNVPPSDVMNLYQEAVPDCRGTCPDVRDLLNVHEKRQAQRREQKARQETDRQLAVAASREQQAREQNPAHDPRYEFWLSVGAQLGVPKDYLEDAESVSGDTGSAANGENSHV